MNLRERLREFIASKSLSEVEFQRIVGLGNGSVSKMGDNTRRSTIDKISNKFPDLNTTWLLTGQGRMTINQQSEENDSIEEVETRPRIPLDAESGSLSVISTSVMDYDCERMPLIPRFPQYDFTIMVKGDSMEPEFHSGDEVACRIINEQSFIQWGRPHVLDTRQGVVLKRIYNRKNTILCRSDNEYYEDFEVPKEDIFRVALVVGSIRLY